MIAIAPLLPKIAGGLALTTVLAASGCAIQTARLGAAKSDLRAEKEATAYLTARIKDIADTQVQQNERLAEWVKGLTSKWKGIADYADQAFHTGEARGRAVAEQYIATHRLRPPAATGGGGTVGPAGSAPGGGSCVPPDAPADAVVVSAGDVRACTALAAYGLGAHRWAIKMVEENAGE